MRSSREEKWEKTTHLVALVFKHFEKIVRAEVVVRHRHFALFDDRLVEFLVVVLLVLLQQSARHLTRRSTQ